jgi:hypothetical protein
MVLAAVEYRPWLAAADYLCGCVTLGASALA